MTEEKINLHLNGDDFYSGEYKERIALPIRNHKELNSRSVSTETQFHNNDSVTIQIDQTSPKTEKKVNSLWNYYHDFTENTTLHGLKYTGKRERTVFERAWWFIMVLLSLCLCAFLVNQVWRKWTESPVIVTFSEISTSISEIPFPAVTICGMVKTRPEDFHYSSMCEKFESEGDEGNFTEDDLMVYDAMSSMCASACLERMPMFINQTYIDKYLEVALQVDDVLDNCFWNLKGLNCSSIFKPLMTENGLCFALNMLSPEEMFKDNVVRNKSLVSEYLSSQWSITKGYSADSTMDSYPIRGQSIGVLNSLDFNLRINHTDPKCNSGYEGFTATLHSPATFPRVLDNNFYISRNFDTLVSVKPNLITTSENVEDYHPNRRQCLFPNEKKLKFFKQYDQDNCLFECVTNITLEACGCVYYAQPRELSTPICGEGSSLCLSRVQSIFFKLQLLSKISGTVNEAGEGTEFDIEKLRKIADECHCLPGCNSLHYESSLTQIKVASVGNDTDSRTRVSIFFARPQFIPSKRSELYGITDFLANCGGLLGVCLGFSILSFVEILYFFMIRFICLIMGKPTHHVE